MPAVRTSLLRVIAAMAAGLVLARARGASDAEVMGDLEGCPPPVDLRLSTSYRGSTHGSITAILRPQGHASGDKSLPKGTLVGPQMVLKIAVPVDLCPLQGKAMLAFKPKQRARFEGTASGG